MDKESLEELVSKWQIWSMQANRVEDGWQSNFPQWLELLDVACKAMCLYNGRSQILHEIELCWAISEEGEELLEYAVEHIDECWPIVEILTESDLPACRWQAYTAASSAGKKANSVLQRGLKDHDVYARRRAILALAKIKPDNARKLAEDLLKDSDPYIRQTSLKMAAATDDAGFIQKIIETLISDDVDHVRNAAHKYKS